ncbi:hypothetical protein C2E20_5225 [Micractinium conductrix]|uniref:Hydroxyproline O-arabinosyltransferase-like domain-containing protein n=1 Tax=Micractinium conductrix TaxID=554055 RepID=A0A2P6VBD3_9CHLO|nr:hypothetical protein C2E20_5225 [Micractinium conductrix]|eukprot:PSC71378.1 hypothetical protein C2E20_5225 [Micractinium conductrix]
MHAFIEIGTKQHHGREAEDGASGDDGSGSAVLAEAGGGGPGWPTTGDTVHIAYTSNGSPYTNYQNLVMYGTYKLAQAMPGGDKMVAFTRILHRTTDDALSNKLPTFRANPLHPECDGWCEYPVADRPNAVRQFLLAAKADPSLIKAPWLYMIETDFVFIKPIAAPRAESDAPSIAFPYGYIQPTYPTIEAVMRKLYPASEGPLTDIPPTGCSPTLMRMDEWMRVTPRWETITAQIEGDEEAKKALDWVREMYAFSVAAALEHVKLDMHEPPESVTMIQPPADHRLGKAHLMHYTWGSIFSAPNGTKVWEWDKRSYTEPVHERTVPKIKLPPPFEEGWKLQDGVAITKDLYDIIVLMITTMNTGIDVARAEGLVAEP